MRDRTTGALMSSDPLQRQVDTFIEQYGVLIERRGGPGMAGRIMALLLVSEDPVLSSADICEALHTSSGTVSTNTRILMQMGWIERVRVPGKRGAFFRVRPGAWRGVFRSVAEDMSHMRRMYEEVARALPGERGARVREALEFYSFIEEELPALLERWEARLAKRRQG